MSSRTLFHQYVDYMIFTILHDIHHLLPFFNHHSILINRREHLFCVVEKRGDTSLELIYDCHMSV